MCNPVTGIPLRSSPTSSLYRRRIPRRMAPMSPLDLAIPRQLTPTVGRKTSRRRSGRDTSLSSSDRLHLTGRSDLMCSTSTSGPHNFYQHRVVDRFGRLHLAGLFIDMTGALSHHQQRRPHHRTGGIIQNPGFLHQRARGRITGDLSEEAIRSRLHFLC